MVEVEVRARLREGYAKVRARLVKKGASFGKPAEQQDAYYRPAKRAWVEQLPGDYVVRVRRSSKGCFLTYKALTEIRGTWDEHEITVSDPEAAEQMLGHLGLVKVLDLRKKRERAKFRGFEICLDRVKGLGDYIEAEIITRHANREAARRKIIKFLQEIGIRESDLDSRGYPEIIFEKRGFKYSGMR